MGHHWQLHWLNQPNLTNQGAFFTKTGRPPIQNISLQIDVSRIGLFAGIVQQELALSDTAAESYVVPM